MLLLLQNQLNLSVVAPPPPPDTRGTRLIRPNQRYNSRYRG